MKIFKQYISIILLLLLIAIPAFAANQVECIEIFSNQSVAASGSVESDPIKLTPGPTSFTSAWQVNSDGIFSFQPKVSTGTFTFTVYWSNFPDPTNHWDSGTVIATGIDSSTTDTITFDPGGPHMWMKIKATETGGTGSPSFSAALCTN